MSVLPKLLQLLQRQPRFRPNTLYVCSGCAWAWMHAEGGHFYGPYFEDGYDCGQWIPWEQLQDDYSDCARRLTARPEYAA